MVSTRNFFLERNAADVVVMLARTARAYPNTPKLCPCSQAPLSERGYFFHDEDVRMDAHRAGNESICDSLFVPRHQPEPQGPTV